MTKAQQNAQAKHVLKMYVYFIYNISILKKLKAKL